MSRRRFTVLAVVTVALAALVTGGLWAANRAAGGSPRNMMGAGTPMMGGSGGSVGMMGGYGNAGGMMGGSGNAAGMMGAYGLPGDGRRVESLEAARQRAEVFADRLDLRVGEVMQFSNGFYAELTTVDGHGATEVLVDPVDGSVGVEYGPAMMWNTSYGMHAGAGSASTRVSAAETVQIAQRWLDDQRPGLRAGEPEVFPGYITLHTLRDGTIAGMMSVNAYSGAVWYHTWHGRYVAMSEG